MIDFFKQDIFILKTLFISTFCHRRQERFGSRERIEVSTFVIGILLKPITFEILLYHFLKRTLSE